MLPKYEIELHSSGSFCGGGGGPEGEAAAAGAVLEAFLMGVGVLNGDTSGVSAFEGGLEGNE